MINTRSKLVNAIALDSNAELKVLTTGSRFHLKKVARLVLIHGYTYEEAGKEYGMTKHAVYELLKRIYLRKYGIEYGKKVINTKDT